MHQKLQILFIMICPLFVFGQNDTINLKDSDGRKQGFWIYYGTDRPEAGYPAQGIIESGTYKDDRKEGIWTKYYSDGITPKLRGEYRNNRPDGVYEKFHVNGVVKEKGCFSKGKYACDTYWYYESGSILKKVIYGEEIDSSYTYLENGCLKDLEVAYKSTPPKRFHVSYREDVCNAVQDTSFYGFNTGITQVSESEVEFQYKKSKKGENAVTEIAVPNARLADSYRYRDEYVGNYNDKALFNGKEDGEHKCINSASELIFAGTIQNGHAWNGKFYFYDNDGILLRIEVWREGTFNAIGQL